MKLYNKVDRRILKDLLANSDEKRITISFYKYAKIGNPQVFRDHLFIEWNNIGVYGRTHVATEGINAQISVPVEHLDDFKQHLDSISFLKGVRLNFAVDDDGKSFYKLKIKVRKKILADGLHDETFDVTDVGIHVDAEAFNKLTDDPGTVLIDMRNHYESEVGHFEGAILPDSDTFREELEMVEEMLQGQEDKNIVMYCTGGIRCEKASAYFKHKGFQNVHQLNGGIINYAKQVKEHGLKNKYHGKNFVFDERLGEQISDEVISVCHLCGAPCDTHTNCKNEACHLLFIQCEACAEKLNSCCSEQCKEIYELPIEEQRALRKGKNKGRNVFKKGRSEKLKFKSTN